MKFSIQQLKDYSYCPRLYKYAHVDKIYTGKVTTIERYFEHCIKQTAYWFFYNIQDGIMPSIKEVRNKFGDLFIGDRSISETMFLSRSNKNTARVLELRSFGMLNNFYNTYSNNYGVPILINKDYELKIKDFVVTGTIPIIRENSNKQIEILSFQVDSTRSRKSIVPSALLMYDVETTASALAFKSIFKEDADMHTFYNMLTSTYKEIVKTNIHFTDFNYLVESVGTAIQNKLFHPVYNHNCITCVYNKICTRI